MPPKKLRFIEAPQKNLKVQGEDEDSIFEIEDQILRMIEVEDIEVFRG